MSRGEEENSSLKNSDTNMAVQSRTSTSFSSSGFASCPSLTSPPSSDAAVEASWSNFAKMKPSSGLISIMPQWCHWSACRRRAAVMYLWKCVCVCACGWLMYDSETFPTCLYHIKGANMGLMYLLHHVTKYIQITTESNWYICRKM